MKKVLMMICDLEDIQSIPGIKEFLLKEESAEVAKSLIEKDGCAAGRQVSQGSKAVASEGLEEAGEFAWLEEPHDLDRFAHQSAPVQSSSSAQSVQETPSIITMSSKEPEESLSVSMRAPRKREVAGLKGDVQEKRSAFIISVMSGSGGVGKSSVVATAAYLACARGFSVAVLDCDLQFGDMHQLMGGVACTSIDDMLTDESLFRSFAKSCNSDLPALICAPNRLEKSEELAHHLDEVLDLSASLFDVVFVNTGSSWSEVNVQLIEKSTCNIFMVDQRASSVRSCQHALELCIRMGLATGQFIYALNRCERSSLFCAMDISNAMNGANVVELKDGGQEVEELLGMGLAGELAASKNEFTTSVDEMLAEVLP